MTRFNYGAGAALALLAAGPICIVTMLVGATLFDGGAPMAGPTGLFVIIPIMLLSIPFGMIIALLPILICGYGMARLGHSQPAARQRWVWAIAGAAIGVAIALAIGPDWQGMALFAVTGSACASIVRHGTRWSDEAA